MDHLLYLAHRIPYPPNKGDKIRSFNILRGLSRHFHIHLGAFVDDPEDTRYASELEPLCKSLHLENINPVIGKIKCLQGLINGMPLSVQYYHCPAMQNWVDQVLDEYDIDRIVVFSSAMARFLNWDHKSRKIVDFVDVDSCKWKQYSEAKSWPANWIYKREAEQLLEFDRNISANADCSVFVSHNEADLFRELSPETSDSVIDISNGVNVDYFDPGTELDSPYPEQEKALVFTGAMDYWANVDAVTWFVEEVFPEIRKQHPDTWFYIVGSNPGRNVKALESYPGIKVTGKVPDVRPYIKYAWCSITCLRVARGIQNKILEAMAMGRPVITTSFAIEGIADAESASAADLDVCITDAPHEMVQAVEQVLENTARPPVSLKNRKYVTTRFGWEASIARFLQYL